MGLSKALRTAQNFLPNGRDGREALARMVRRLGRQLHDPDFAAVGLFPPRQLLLDVGANYGQSVTSMRLVQPEARIISYEPNIELAEKISDLFRLDADIKVQPFGLSDTSGTFDLFVPYYRNFPYPGLASLNEEDARSWLSSENLYFFRARNVCVKRIRCWITTLDSQNLAPYFIKIDVQGVEYDMLQGSRETLSRHEPILLIESPGRDPRIPAFLDSLGYREFEFLKGRFVQRKSEGTNGFFITKCRQVELEAYRPNAFTQRPYAV
jgi:FkbM family methyltransferase